MRILIEGAGTATAISVLKGVQKAQHNLRRACYIHTFVLDPDSNNAGRYFSPQYIQSPLSSSPGYVDWLCNFCKDNQIDLFIPIIDYGFSKIAWYKARGRFGNTKVLIAPPNSIDICADKYKTYKFLQSRGIPTPYTFPAGTRFKEFPPMIMKPRTGGRASLNVHEINDVQDLDYWTSKTDNYILQERMFGIEFTADNLASLGGERYIGSVIRERLETKGGLSVKSRVSPESIQREIRPHVEKIITELKIPGACNIQGFYNDDELAFTEINPRFAGTHAHTIEAGMNSILHIIRMFRGEDPSEIKFNIDSSVEMIRYWNEIFISGEDVWTWKNFQPY